MKKYSILLSFLALTLVSTTTQAQKLSHFAQYYLIPHTLNPAFSGIEDFLDVKAGGRFSTLPSSVNEFSTPANYFLAANYSIHPEQRGNPAFKALRVSDPQYVKRVLNSSGIGYSRHGIGFTLSRREIGMYDNTTALLSYAFHLPITQQYAAALGVSTGIVNERLVGTDFMVIDGSDPIFIGLSGDGSSVTTFDLNAGITVYSDKLYVGYAANQLTSGSISSGGITDSINVSYITHTAQAGVRFPLSPGYGVEISGVANISPDLGLTYVASARVRFQELISIGVGYRSEGALTGYLGLVLGEQLTVGYSYDYIFSQGRREYTTGAHEVVLGYRLFNQYLNPTKFW